MTKSDSWKEMEAVSDILLFLLRYPFLLNDATKPQNSRVQKTPQLNAPQGNIYMGARYLDPKYSRWISVDPALGEYIPHAPVNDEAKKHNQNLPGMGGVFNSVNLSLFHYAGNNPVRYVDPDGKLITTDGDFIFYPNLNPDGSMEETPLQENKDIIVVWGFLLTNQKRKIECYLKTDRTSNTEFNFDCHGLTFTDGRVWINDDQVEKILQDDGYKKTNVPQKGDILIQRDSNGDIFHSATVIEFDKKNNRALVKEAMGHYKFSGGNDINYQWYTVDPMRDTFYKRGCNKNVKVIPKYFED